MLTIAQRNIMGEIQSFQQESAQFWVLHEIGRFYWRSRCLCEDVAILFYSVIGVIAFTTFGLKNCIPFQNQNVFYLLHNILNTRWLTATLTVHSGHLFCLRPKHAGNRGTVARSSKEQSFLACVPQNYTTKVLPRTITLEMFVMLQVLAEINVLECAKKKCVHWNRLMLMLEYNYLIKTGTVS